MKKNYINNIGKKQMQLKIKCSDSLPHSYTNIAMVGLYPTFNRKLIT